MKQENTIPYSPYIPFFKDVADYNVAFGHLYPYQFMDWKTEVLSWKESCYLHAGLNPPMPARITGPDALTLFRDHCINDFSRFSVGASKHAVMCNYKGNVMADGMLLRTEDNAFVSYFLSPYLEYIASRGNYDVNIEDLTGKSFLFQLGGPLSLKILEAATQESLSDIKFIWHRTVHIYGDELPPTGIAVRIFRLGVAGTLAYEVHGDIKDAPLVYQALMAAGQPFNLVRLGMRAYGMNHTENGFAQAFIHFLPAWTQDEDFMDYLNGKYDALLAKLPGSAGVDITRRYFNPIDLGWGHMITFDHDFVGRAALEVAMQQQAKKIVTLEWYADDIKDIYASYFESGESFEFMEFPANPIWTTQSSIVVADEVQIDSRSIGISSGRIYSFYYRRMISLAVIETEYAIEGTTLEVIWGNPSKRQKKIRAKVSRFPYLTLPRNRDIDTKALP